MHILLQKSMVIFLVPGDFFYYVRAKTLGFENIDPKIEGNIQTGPRSTLPRRHIMSPGSGSAAAGGPAMDDPLELTHVVGYSGAPRSLLSRPGGANAAALYVGSVVVLADLDDPHNRSFFEGTIA